MPVVGIPARTQPRQRHDGDHPPVLALLFLLDLLERLANHQRAPAHFLVARRRPEIALRVAGQHHRFPGGALRLRHGRRHRPCRPRRWLQLHHQGRAVRSQPDRQALVDRARSRRARPFDDKPVAALQIAHRPMAVGERHHRVSAADLDVLNRHFAISGHARCERAPKNETRVRRRCGRAAPERLADWTCAGCIHARRSSSMMRLLAAHRPIANHIDLFGITVIEKPPGSGGG